MRPYDRKVPFLGTKPICDQFNLHVGLISRWRDYTGIDNRPIDQRGIGQRVKMSGCEIWQMMSFLDIVGYVPGLGPGDSPSQVQSLEWLWRPVLDAIEEHEVGWVAATPQDHRMSSDMRADMYWALEQQFVMIYTLAPPVSLISWLHDRWAETNP